MKNKLPAWTYKVITPRGAVRTYDAGGGLLHEIDANGDEYYLLDNFWFYIDRSGGTNLHYYIGNRHWTRDANGTERWEVRIYGNVVLHWWDSRGNEMVRHHALRKNPIIYYRSCTGYEMCMDYNASGQLIYAIDSNYNEWKMDSKTGKLAKTH